MAFCSQINMQIRHHLLSSVSYYVLKHKSAGNMQISHANNQTLTDNNERYQ